jgi:hypothetical protein
MIASCYHAILSTHHGLLEWVPRVCCPGVHLKWRFAEAHFELSSRVIKHFRYWPHNNPWDLHQRRFHSPKVTVCCAIFDFYVWSPQSFAEDDVTVTVISDRYWAMLGNIFRPKLDDLFDEHRSENVWFQQDDARAHISGRSFGIIREMFPVVSLLGDVAWPPRSPDFTPYCFILWSYLKAEVYQHRP